jgi:hypothetical protein
MKIKIVCFLDNRCSTSTQKFSDIFEARIEDYLSQLLNFNCVSSTHIQKDASDTLFRR